MGGQLRSGRFGKKKVIASSSRVTLLQPREEQLLGQLRWNIYTEVVVVRLLSKVSARGVATKD